MENNIKKDEVLASENKPKQNSATYEHFLKMKTDKQLASTYEKSEPQVKKKRENVSDTIKIGIVGIGSIGTPISLILASSGYDVEITKKNTDALMIDNCVNLEINGAFGDKSYLVPCVQNNKFTSKKDIIIMCTQSFSTAGALGEVKKFLKPDGIVVSMQNVLNLEDVLKVVPKERYIAIIIDWTATRLEMNHVLVLRQADMHIGVFDDNAKQYLPMVKEILEHIQPVKIHDNMYSFIASRFVLSCAVSSVLALTGHNLRKSMQNKVAKKLLVGVISEMLEVFEAYGVNVPPYCDSLDYYKFTEKSVKGMWYRAVIFARFVKKNGDMSSSILRALENKKKTELDSMCSRIVEMAKAKDMKVPFNETVAKFLHDVEEGNETIFMGNMTNPCFTNLKINRRR